MMARHSGLSFWRWISLLMWGGAVLGRPADLLFARYAAPRGGRLGTLQEAAEYVRFLQALDVVPERHRTWYSADDKRNLLRGFSAARGKRHGSTARQWWWPSSNESPNDFDPSYKRAPSHGFFSARGRRAQSYPTLKRIPPAGFSSVRGKRMDYDVSTDIGAPLSRGFSSVRGNRYETLYNRGPPEGFSYVGGKRRETAGSDKRRPPDWFSSVRGKRMEQVFQDSYDDRESSTKRASVLPQLASARGQHDAAFIDDIFGGHIHSEAYHLGRSRPKGAPTFDRDDSLLMKRFFEEGEYERMD